MSIEVLNLSKQFGTFTALHDVSLQVHSGELLALLGPSGSGKTTLLRVIAGLETADNGQVLFHGEDATDQHVRERQVGFVFQHYALFRNMTIFDNVAFGVKLYETLHRGELEERVEWALNKAALWEEVKDKLNQSGTSLSGGQQQRLCIARTIAVKPEVVLLDEPTSALDPISTARIEDLIFQLKKDYTIIMVTHNMQQAARVSDYTAYMYLGELIEYGATDMIFTKPRKKATEDYITGKFG